MLNIPELMKPIYQKAINPGRRRNLDGEIVDNICHCHPRPNDEVKLVTIAHPTTSKPLSAFEDPEKIAVLLPNGQAPAALYSIALKSWLNAHNTIANWLQVDGQKTLNEPCLYPNKVSNWPLVWLL
jgi:hypothetical protein